MKRLFLALSIVLSGCAAPASALDASDFGGVETREQLQDRINELGYPDGADAYHALKPAFRACLVNESLRLTPALTLAAADKFIADKTQDNFEAFVEADQVNASDAIRRQIYDAGMGCKAKYGA